MSELITVDCPDAKLSGFTVDGTFAQYVVSHVPHSSHTGFHLPSPFQVSYLQHVTPIPDGIDSFDAASILCAVSVRSILVDLIPFIHCFVKGVTVYRAIKNSDTNIGDWIVLPGAGGGLGHLGDSLSFCDGFRSFIGDSFDQSYPICVSDGSSCGSYRYEQPKSPRHASDPNLDCRLWRRKERTLPTARCGKMD